MTQEEVIETIRRTASPDVTAPLAGSALCLSLLAEISRTLARMEAALDTMTRAVNHLPARRDTTRPLADTWPRRP